MEYKNFKIIAAVILIFLVLFSFNKFLYQGLKNISFLIAQPIEKFFWQESSVLSKAVEAFFNLRGIEAENQALLKENFILKNQILELKDLKEQNKDLRQALSLGLEKEYQLIASNIILKQAQGDFALIDKGEADQVVLGMPLITKEKVLVGKVDAVFKNFSRVILISEKDFTFSIKIQAGGQTVLGAAKGQGNFKNKFELVPKEAQLTVGDLVSTSVLGRVFPANLLVGEVKSIERSDPEPFQYGELKTYFKNSLPGILFLIKTSD